MCLMNQASDFIQEIIIKLINLLKNLRDIGNTVLVVEHDPQMMREADILVDMGPKAGIEGGEIIGMGSYEDIIKNKNSLTGKYLTGEIKIPVPKKRNTKKTKSILIEGASEHNLKNINVEVPLNKLVVITGVSGSGKSTLIHDIFYGGLAKYLGKGPSKIGLFNEIKGAEYFR